jgi:hypothetical protein
VLTPGRSIAALPLKETPPMCRAVDSVAAEPAVAEFPLHELAVAEFPLHELAVAEFPLHELAVEAFPLSAPLKVAAVTVPSVSREI